MFPLICNICLPVEVHTIEQVVHRLLALSRRRCDRSVTALLFSRNNNVLNSSSDVSSWWHVTHNCSVHECWFSYFPILGPGWRNRANCEMDGGDLGLGRGLKPGAIPKDETHLDFIPNDNARDTTCTNNVVNTTETVIHVANCFQAVSIDTQRSQHDTVNGIVADSDTETAENDSNTFSDREASRDSKQSIVIGTSLQEQKHLFSRDLENVRRHISSPQEDYAKCNYYN